MNQCSQCTVNSCELDRKVRILQVGTVILGCFTLFGSAKLQTFPRTWRSVTTCRFLCPVHGYLAVTTLHNSVGCSTALFLQGQLLCAAAFLAMNWTMGLVASSNVLSSELHGAGAGNVPSSCSLLTRAVTCVTSQPPQQQGNQDLVTLRIALL